MAMIEQEVEFFDRLERENWYQGLLHDFVEFLAINGETKILDVGCGPGALTRLMAQEAKEVAGVDLQPAMVERAEENSRQEGLKNISFQQAGYLALPFPAGSYDLVVTTTVLSVVPDTRAALREMARVARIGGSVASVTNSIKCSPPMALRYAKEHNLPDSVAEEILLLAGLANPQRRFTQEALAMLCEECGLRESEMQSKMDEMIIFAKGKKS